ncbi:FUSC family protein [Phreatobacter sp. AB_2022a]|uniref:FUSC family protein n=1 Tax=Phreatobacter sp. AB_2022a TaxID=3003134 RepID=UPI0022873E3C|nr:FUSC family protein [Phreatobacter sp. AB_2022a]MCZ0737373.1 FUSC family protein [Phreatobacter sp. AB_2022a]
MAQNRPVIDLPVLTVLRDELRPYPGRLGLALRMAIMCVGVVLVTMTFQVPEAAISGYLIFFAAKDDAGTSTMMGIALIVGAAVGIAIGIVFIMASADDPMIRLILMAVFTFVGMFFARASKLGPVASTVGFVLAFVMTLFDLVPIPELLIRALVWMWIVVLVPMCLLILVNLVGGRSPGEALRDVVAMRLEAVAALFRDGGPQARERLMELLGEGNGEARKLQKLAGLLTSLPVRQARRLGELLGLSYRLMVLAGAVAGRAGPEAVLPPVLTLLADPCAAAARAIRSGQELPSAEPAVVDRPFFAFHAGPQPAALADMAGLVAAIGRALGPGHEPVDPGAGPAEPFLQPDAFTNPTYVRFALRTMLAVVICYLLYTSLDWFNVHTALVTCFFVALSSLGETIHKLTLRISGALIGGALGLGSIIFLMPHMTDVGEFALLVGAVSFAAAWIAVGSERISYMGWQIALAFFLCTLNSFGPSFELATARDRVIGILIGNVVMTVVFSNVWPESIGPAIRSAVGTALGALADLVRPAGAAPDPAALAAERFHTTLAKARRGRQYLDFEPSGVRMGGAALAATDSALAGIEALAAPFFVLAEHPPSLAWAAHAPKPVQDAAETYQKQVTNWLAAYALAITEGRPAAEWPAWSGSLGAVEAAFAKAGSLPAEVQAELGRRLALYRDLDGQLRRFGATAERADLVAVSV